jgi:hypothetical protein
MAHRIKAVNAYRPRIEQGSTVQKPELIRAVSRATSLVEGSVDQAVKEVRDQIVEFCRAGRAVKVDELGTFTPTLDLEGYFAIAFRADPSMSYNLNMPGTFSGKTSNELIARWNEEHGDDPVVIED